MRDGRLEFEKELFVLWIVDRAVEIRTGEASDRFERVPKGNEQEVRPVALRPAEDGDAAVPRGLEVFLEPLSFRYAKYASAFDDWVTPCHVLAIISSPRTKASRRTGWIRCQRRTVRPHRIGPPTRTAPRLITTWTMFPPIR